MNKKILIVFSSMLLITGCSSGCGKTSEPEPTRTVPEITSEEVTETTNNTNSTSVSIESDETKTTTNTGSGGNPNTAIIFAITISEQKYFYDNQEISIEDLTDKLDEAKSNGDIEVTITDNHGTVKAFDELTKILDSKEIAYTINETS